MLLLAYAIVRLRHWWVIAVRRQFLLSCFHFELSACGLPRSEIRDFIFQVTTLISSAFLIVKVILSEVGFLGLTGDCFVIACRCCFPFCINSL